MKTALDAARYRIESTNRSSLATRPDMPSWTVFSQRAEEAGIDSILVSFSRYEPDPLLVSCALGRATSRLKFIAAYRSGLMQPATFVQQVNTLSSLIDGRVSLNIVAGSSSAEQRGYGDFLDHDERYARAGEFLTICNSLWRDGGPVDFDGKYLRIEGGILHTPFVAPDRPAPEIYVSGHSEPAERLALTQGSCWLRVIDTAESLRSLVSRTRQRGVEVCLRLCLVCRETREEAIEAAGRLLPDRDAGTRERLKAVKDDSQMYREASDVSDESAWLSRSLWAGLTPHYGPVWMTLVGSPMDIAEAFLDYKRIGVSQFIISGWPELEEMETFGREVVPLVRRAEERLEEHSA